MFIGKTFKRAILIAFCIWRTAISFDYNTTSHRDLFDDNEVVDTTCSLPFGCEQATRFFICSLFCPCSSVGVCSDAEEDQLVIPEESIDIYNRLKDRADQQ